tara:strand:- start:551 stop:898 length:348 start_codon:yes stop_codon:yes gene_type:complete
MLPNFVMKKLFNNFFKFLFFSTFFLSIFNQVKSDEKYDKGKIIFLEQGNCAVCHSLLDAGSDGNIGPNLNEIKPDIMRVIIAVTNGIGVMPAYQGELTTEEIEAVSYYVSVSSEK